MSRPSDYYADKVSFLEGCIARVQASMDTRNPSRTHAENLRHFRDMQRDYEIGVKRAGKAVVDGEGA